MTYGNLLGIVMFNIEEGSFSTSIATSLQLVYEVTYVFVGLSVWVYLGQGDLMMIVWLGPEP